MNSNSPNNLKAIMMERGVSELDIAFICGVSPASVYNWQRGTFVPSLKTARRISRFLGVSDLEIWPENKT
jgi:transcriptional regulator with XRE-family HTH domain